MTAPLSDDARHATEMMAANARIHALEDAISEIVGAIADHRPLQYSQCPELVRALHSAWQYVELPDTLPDHVWQSVLGHDATANEAAGPEDA